MDKIKEQMRKHNLYLSDKACRDDEAIYLREMEEDIRPPFFRDIDKIIYSLSFIRYQDKTQVFANNTHDHVQKRMLHVQLVSKIARTIGRTLGLNEDLIEAASLGHDSGHVPFGHAGEAILNDICLRHDLGYFNHNVQSVRNFMVVENYGKGLNLTVQVLDAILSHNGEIAQGRYKPCLKSKEEFLEEYHKSYFDKNILREMKPMTLEGCVVRVSDLIAYLGRDIDDAVRLNMISREDIPKKVREKLGGTTREIVNTCILDIINNSYGKNEIILSDDVFRAIEELKNFNYQNIYFKAMTKEENVQLREMFETLFESYFRDVDKNKEDSPINYSYLKNMSEEYKRDNEVGRIVVDYIAGMTDGYFVSEYKRVRK